MFSWRYLGIIAMVCAPARLIGVVLERGVENPLIDGVMGTAFMAGWICM